MKKTKWIITVTMMLLSGLLAGCTPSVSGSGSAAAATGKTAVLQTESDSAKISEEEMDKEEDKVMKISVEGNGNTVVFQLVDNSASRSLYEQLPLTVEVQDYSNNERDVAD